MSNDVRIRLSLDGVGGVVQGLGSVASAATSASGQLTSMATQGLATAARGLQTFTSEASHAVGLLTTSVVSNYAQYEQNIGGIETMFGSSADKMKSFAADAYKTAGLSANEYMSQVTSFSAALLQGLGGDTEKAADLANVAMVDMSDNAAKFGTNIGDIQHAYQGFAKQNYTMLDNLKLGYGGTQAEMARLINDSGVLGDTMTVTAENVNQVSFDKIIEAIHTVQDRMGIAGTTAKEASETISGSIDSLKASWANFLVGLGRDDADIAALLGQTLDSLETVIQNITPVIQHIGENMKTLGPLISEMISEVVGLLVEAIPVLLEAGINMIAGLVQGLTESAPQIGQVIGDLIPAMVELIAMAIPSLVEAGATIILNIAQGVLDHSDQIFSAISTAIIQLIQIAGEFLPQFLEMGAQLIVELAEGLSQDGGRTVDAIVTTVQKLGEAITQNLPIILQAAGEIIQALLDGIIQVLPSMIPVAVDILLNLAQFIVDNLPPILDAGIQVIVMLMNGITQMIPELIPMIIDLVEKLIWAIIDNLPAFIEAGIKMIMALGEGIIDNTPRLLEAIPPMINALIDVITEYGPELASAGLKLLIALLDNAPQILDALIDGIGNILSHTLDAMQDSSGEFAEMGGELLKGLVEGFLKLGSYAIRKIQEFLGDLVDGAMEYLGIHSPSRVFRDRIGEPIVQGIAVGIERAEGEAQAAMQHVNTGLVRTAESGRTELTRVARSTTTDLQDIWDELDAAYHGGDWGYGTIAKYVGDDAARWVTNVAGGLGQQISSTQSFFAEWAKNLQEDAKQVPRAVAHSVVSTTDQAVKTTRKESDRLVDSINVMWQEVRAAWDGDDFGMAETQRFFGERGGTWLLDVTSTMGEHYRAATSQLNDWTQSLQRTYDRVAADGQAMLSRVVGHVSGFQARMEQAGLQLWNSLAARVDQAKSYITERVTVITDAIQEKVHAYIDPIAAEGERLLQSITREAQTAEADVRRDVGNLLQGIIQTVDDATGGMATSGINLVEGMWRGVESQSGWFQDQMRNWADDIVRNTQRELGIYSPSRVFRDEVGKHIPSGIAEGVQAATPTALLSIQHLSDRMVATGMQHTLQVAMPQPHPVWVQPPQPVPVYTSTPAAPVAATTSHATHSTNYNAPLVHVEHMEVRNDQDIRDLSKQLKQDIDRERRARGEID